MIRSRPEDDGEAAAALRGSGAPRRSSGDDGDDGGADRRNGAGKGLPVLDRVTLDSLGVELSDQAGALLFAGMFVDMLPQRIGAVEGALAAHDPDAAVVALLSLHVSASMVGARRLEEVSSTGLGLIDEPSEHHALVARLQHHGADLESALSGMTHQDAQPR